MIALVPFAVLALLGAAIYRWRHEGAGWPLLALLPVVAISALSLYQHWRILLGEGPSLDLILSGSMGQILFTARLVCAVLAFVLAHHNRLGILLLALASFALDPDLTGGILSLSRCVPSGCG